VYTWGRDAMLAVWDLKTRRQLKHCKLESGGDAIAFSNSGKYLVLGFMNGTMFALDDNFNALSKRRDRAGVSIQCLKFSPDDSILAAGGHDQMIMTYSVERNFKPMKKLRGLDTTVWQMDFSLDSQTLICDSMTYFYA
jgi:WD40 repeat protein